MKVTSNQSSLIILLLTIVILCISPEIESQKISGINMQQFLFPDFSVCTIKMKSGSVSTAIGNYNTVLEKMVFLKDNSIYGLNSIAQVDTISFGNRHFVASNKVFYEVLLDAPVSLLVQHKDKIIPPPKTVGYGGTSQLSNVDSYNQINMNGGTFSLDIPSDYEIRYSPIFWIERNGDMNSFIGKKQFTNIFRERKKEIESFIKENDVNFEDISSLIKLVKYCNDLKL